MGTSLDIGIPIVVFWQDLESHILECWVLEYPDVETMCFRK
jgi:hypothetical protein